MVGAGQLKDGRAPTALGSDTPPDGTILVKRMFGVCRFRATAARPTRADHGLLQTRAFL